MSILGWKRWMLIHFVQQASCPWHQPWLLCKMSHTSKHTKQFWKGNSSFKAHHPSKSLVGFEPRTEPELSTRDSLYLCASTNLVKNFTEAVYVSLISSHLQRLKLKSHEICTVLLLVPLSELVMFKLAPNYLRSS